MLRTLMAGAAMAVLAGTAAADCAGDEAGIRAKAAEVTDLAAKIEAQRTLVQEASAGFKSAATDAEKATFDEQLSAAETTMDDLKSAHNSALYDIVDLSLSYKKTCKGPAQPLLDELGIKAEDLPD
jgi:hypothetical protein